ncbi:MAG: factor-independent urate hydroxylase [Actinomycetales bacterium]
MAHVLGPNQYGKAEVRLVAVDRDGVHAARHEIRDLTVTTQLRGDFESCHTEGDNSRIIPTDTQKNTVYALAREHGVRRPEDLALRLARHFLAAPQVDGVRVAVDQHPWRRITVGGTGPEHEHGHAFERAGAERRTVVVTLDGDAGHVFAGLADLVVLKSTGSEFHGYPRDRYTTLEETSDRILATSVTARWRYSPAVLDPAPDGGDAGYDFDAAHAAIRTSMLECFATLHSRSLQQTLFAMGGAALDACPEVVEVRLSMPNKHHFLVDLGPFDLDNPHTVFHAADRPYGLIEGSILREGAASDERAWQSVVGFC